jgi:hypothetical protein
MEAVKPFVDEFGFTFPSCSPEGEVGKVRHHRLP